MERHRRSVTLVLTIGLVLALVLMPATIFAQEPLKFVLIGSLAQEPEIHESLAKFTERTGIEVEVISTASWPVHQETVVSMTVSGLAPDVVYGSGGAFNYFINNNLVMTIEKMAARDIDLSVYPDPVMDFWERDGKLYGLPTALSLSNLYYNPAMFLEAGIAEPPVDWTAEAFGWDEFVTTARRLTRDPAGSGTPTVFGLQSFGWDNSGSNYLPMWGLALTDRRVTEWYGDSPEVIAAIEKMAALSTEFGVVGGSLIRGTAAMVPDQAFLLNNLRNVTDIEWNVAVLPKGTVRGLLQSGRIAPSPLAGGDPKDLSIR